MTHRVAVQLCPRHRDVRYLRRDGGRAFASALEEVWRAHGVASAFRRAALRTHRRRYGARADAGRLPGSYSWPALRAEAERRFAADEPPDAVIDDLRTRHGEDHATVPTRQTMRRWFREGRWLDTDSANAGARSGSGRPPRRRLRPSSHSVGGSSVKTVKYWYTKSGKPPHPLRHIVPYGARLSVFPPFDALFFDMSRRGPADDDFGDRWIHGSSG